MSFSKFIYHYLNDSEKDYFIGFNRRDPPRLLTLAVAPEVSLSACQIESFSQWFRIDSKSLGERNIKDNDYYEFIDV